MQKSKILLFFVSIFLLTTLFNTVLGEERLLCVISSDLDSDIGKMTYEMDEDERRIKHIYSEKWVNNKLVERTELNINQLINGGIILHKKDKYVTVRLYSDNFDEERGGTLYLDTLFNAIKGERKEYTIDVAKNHVNEIEMSFNNQIFTKMKFIAKKAPIVGVVGIGKVDFSK